MRTSAEPLVLAGGVPHLSPILPRDAWHAVARVLAGRSVAADSIDQVAVHEHPQLMDEVQFAAGGREVQMRKKEAPDFTPASR